MTASINITVYGLWHLGCVTAASLAQEGFKVCGLDSDTKVVEGLQSGSPPIFEPGMTELIQASLTNGQLRFTSDYADALQSAEVLWVAFDTPVDTEDRADVDYVLAELDKAFPYIKSGTTIIISSQLPVGTTEALKKHWVELQPDKHLIYCYSPENLRLGNALKAFRAEDRIVLGLDDESGRDLLTKVFSPFCPRLEWMSIKSAEMTKHALNSFLAVSVAMINEIARICEYSGADAKEVERGLKSEQRIGQKAYVGPGGPFAGGTLARDLRFLTQLGAQYGLETPLLSGTLASNELHKEWVQKAVAKLLIELPSSVRVTILGITYKPGTDTLRRSEAVNLGLWLVEQGVQVTFHDPVTTQLPEDLAAKFHLTSDLAEALEGADILVIATGWQVYRDEINSTRLIQAMRHPNVIDQNRFLNTQLNNATDVVYLAVGKPSPVYTLHPPSEAHKR